MAGALLYRPSFAPDRASSYKIMPPAILFSDDAERRIDAEEAIALAGGHVVAALGLDDALERLDSQSAGLVLVTLRHDHGSVLDAILGRLVALAEAGQRSLVSVSEALIDVAAARVDHPSIELLVEPTKVEMVAAIAALTVRPGTAVREGSDRASDRLLELSREVGRIAHALAALSDGEGARPTSSERAPVAEADGEPVIASPEEAALLRTLIRLRRARDQHFDPDLFADPAWDMLLDLAAARQEGRQVAVSSLCIAAAVPPTTALRWMKAMLDRGLLVRRADPLDGRRVFIELSEGSARAMSAYLGQVRRAFSRA